MGISVRARDSIHGDDHLVEFYETQKFLIDTVCAFLVPAILEGNAAIVVATAAHRDEFETALMNEGIDLAAAVREGRYLAFDALDVLSQFMVDGEPDAARFGDTIGAVMDRASAGGRRLRVYGEMVALLWDEGDVASAVALEDLWNGLAELRTFVLLCAYPMRIFDDEVSAADARRVCEQHGTAVPSGRCAQPAAAELRSVVLLKGRDGRVGAGRDLSAFTEIARREFAYIDTLTRLGNRRAFDLYLERAWQLTNRDGSDALLVVAHLDGVKELKESSGDTVSDEVLRQVAEILRSAARRTYILARIGYDEFGILLMRCDEAAADRFKGLLRETLDQWAWPAQAHIIASFGHASLLQAASPAKALNRAHLAMLAQSPALFAA